MKKQINIYDFFDLVLSGDLGQLDIDNYIQKKTNNYHTEKLRLLLNDIEYCLFCEKEEKLGSYSKEHIEEVIVEWRKKNKELPFKDLPELKSKDGKNVIPASKILDLEKLLFPYHFFTVYQLIAKLQNLIKENSTNSTERNERSNITISDTKASVIKAFEFMQGIDPRKHKLILPETDFNKLVTWVTFYFDNNFELPAITEPIQRYYTNKGNVVYTFMRLFKQLHPTKTRPDSLFQLIQLCFQQHRHDKIETLKKQNEPAHYEELIKKT